jgi:uncharacterized membrane protein
MLSQCFAVYTTLLMCDSGVLKRSPNRVDLQVVAEMTVHVHLTRLLSALLRAVQHF